MRHQKSPLAQTITYYPKDRLATFRSLSLGERSAVFAELSNHLQQQILVDLTMTEAVDLVDHLDLRMAEKVIMRMQDARRRSKIIKRLKTEVSDKIEYFLRFHPKATATLIHFNYVLVPDTATLGEVGEIIDAHYQELGKFPEILVQENGALVGEILLTTLVKERTNAQLEKFIKPIKTISYQAEVSDIVNTFTDSEHKKIVVLDNDNSVLGIIYADDALTLFGKLPAESLYNIAGVDESERPFDSVGKKFSQRYRWLILNLVTAFIAGSVVLIFTDTVEQLAILAVYIPIVAGMGGNAASQAFAVMVRGITMGSVSLESGLPVIWKEVQAGALNGLVIGGIVALISVVINGSWLLGVVVSLAMITVHIVAGLFGAFVPLILKRMGKDPASTSMIFISTATDVFGILALLGFGSLILL
ncbi:MAG: magnesium transporter [Patescibacteria group bacterium]